MLRQIEPYGTACASWTSTRGTLSRAAYFSNYDSIAGWRLATGWLDGQEAIAVFSNADAAQPSYFIQLEVIDERIAATRDFRYVPYIAADAVFEA